MLAPQSREALIYPLLTRKQFFYACAAISVALTSSALFVPLASLLLAHSPLGAVPSPMYDTLALNSQFPKCIVAANRLAIVSGPFTMILAAFTNHDVSKGVAEVRKKSALSRMIAVLFVAALWTLQFLHDPGPDSGFFSAHVFNATAQHRLVLALWANGSALLAASCWIFVAIQLKSLVTRK